MQASAAAIAAATRADGRADPTKTPLVADTLRGIARQHAAVPEAAPRQAAALDYATALDLMRAAGRPQRRGRGQESPAAAAARGRRDAAIVALAFCAGLRRSEIASLVWGDITPTARAGQLRVRVRASKTNASGRREDLRLLAGPFARAVDALRTAEEPTAAERVVPLSPHQVNRRVQILAAALGLEGVSSHSGRRGLASELIQAARHRPGYGTGAGDPVAYTAMENREARRDRKRIEAKEREAKQRPGTPAPLALAPQAVFHWDRADQERHLLDTTLRTPDLAFLMKSLALVALPRTDPGKRERYVRKNGPWTLVMTAGGEKGRLPYGNLPRLLLAWVCSEAVRTKRRHLLLGHSLAHFMRELGVESSMSGGTTGIRTRLQTQMQRLFSTAVELTYTTDEGVHRVADHITTRMDLWWNTRRPTEPVLWESSVTLGQDFFDEIIRHPVPIDMNILRAMKRSSLGLDVYLWLTCRLFTASAPLRLSWPQLYRQLGAHPEATCRGCMSGHRRQEPV